MLKIPLDKELTAYCLVETRTKLEELIPAAMVDYGLNRVSAPVVAAVPDKMVSHGIWFTLDQVVSEHL